MFARGQEWERDGHRIRLIDPSLDDAQGVVLAPVRIQVKRVWGWHPDVDFYDGEVGLILRDTLIEEWELVED